MAPQAKPSIVNCQNPLRSPSTLKSMFAARQAYSLRQSGIIRGRAPGDRVSDENASGTSLFRTRFVLVDYWTLYIQIRLVVSSPSGVHW